MNERLPIPTFVIHVLIAYVGIVGLEISKQVEPNYLTGWYLLMVAIFTAFASYGVISFIQDLRKGGIKEVCKRLRKAFKK